MALLVFVYNRNRTKYITPTLCLKQALPTGINNATCAQFKWQPLLALFINLLQFYSHILCLAIQIFFPVLYYWGVISGSISAAVLSECAIMHSQMQRVLLFHVFVIIV